MGPKKQPQSDPKAAGRQAKVRAGVKIRLDELAAGQAELREQLTAIASLLGIDGTRPTPPEPRR